ncbi:hypothetical protein E2C01_078618 [Portunus trituberculatus]|uniref:Uncharacterized protein n=1 Tax=Portunus trituberculatus TaxID=210409 RepID=A0A5B7IQQ2_PORTR|nr:hypothetical protein [Portunus trituberculatus]
MLGRSYLEVLLYIYFLPASAWATPYLVLLCNAYVLCPDPFCPWCRTTPKAMEHFLLQSPRFHSQHIALCSWLSSLAIITLDMPTLLVASGVHPSRQPAVLRLTCTFLRKTGQLPRL